jgi:uncharacterized protein (DUF849 family)
LSVTLIKACLNGSRAPQDHPTLPTTPEQLAEAAAQAVGAGAGALHIHPRRADGAQSLDAQTQAEALLAIRRRCPGVPIGVSTAIWIEPDPDRRLAQAQSWTTPPDFASINFDEPGVGALAAALLARGVGVEAGLANEADVEALLASGLAGRLLRILIEPESDEPEPAMRAAEQVIAALDAAHVTAPRLLHGAEAATWPVLRLALTHGYDTRIGLEDTLVLPSGALAPSNAALVEAAVALAQSAGRW